MSDPSIPSVSSAPSWGPPDSIEHALPRPSILPALEISPLFWPEESTGESAEAGTDRHTILESLLRGEADAHDRLAMLPEDQRTAVEWAWGLFAFDKELIPRLWIERRLSITDGEFVEIIGGTPDIVDPALPAIWDFKWRHRNYAAQMAAYAWLVCETTGADQCKTNILYGIDCQVETHTYTSGEAEQITREIIARAQIAERCHPSQYCTWCSRRPTCPELIGAALAVAAGREDWPPDLKNWHSSQLTEPADMAKALWLVTHLEKWCQSVRHHATMMIQKQGLTIPGWTLKNRNIRELRDINAAFAALAIPAEHFLPHCKVSLPGLEKTYAQLNGLPQTVARKVIAEKLADIIQTSQSQYLAREHATQEELPIS